MLKIRSGPVALAVSALALVLSMGGTGYALTQTSGARHISTTAAAKLPAWHRLTLQHGWVYGGFGSYLAAYSKDSGDVVRLRGSLASGSTSADAFRLPPGARPSHTIWLPIYAFNGTIGALEIEANGDAFLFDANGEANVTQYSSLDGVTFRVP